MSPIVTPHPWRSSRRGSREWNRAAFRVMGPVPEKLTPGANWSPPEGLSRKRCSGTQGTQGEAPECPGGNRSLSVVPKILGRSSGSFFRPKSAAHQRSTSISTRKRGPSKRDDPRDTVVVPSNNGRLATRGGAVRVATTTRVHTGTTHLSPRLRRSLRTGKTVTHETLGNRSPLPDLLQRETFVLAAEAVRITRSLPRRHVAAVLTRIHARGLDDRIASAPTRRRDRVVARNTMVTPGSAKHLRRSFYIKNH
jgi:hypothetical protein